MKRTARRTKTAARPKPAPAVPPSMPTAAHVLISLIGANNLVFQHLLPLAETELTTLFPLDGFESELISNAVERMAETAKRRFPSFDNEPTHVWDHADAGFVLGLVAGLRIGGAR